MSSLPSFDTENEPKIARSVEKFFKDYKVMELLRMLDQALKAGLTAKYVMFDTWFFNPHQIV
ncbi:hypothetical protein ACXO2T_03155, partial [Lactobacillus delbrueckii subsp. bulgaricus]